MSWFKLHEMLMLQNLKLADWLDATLPWMDAAIIAVQKKSLSAAQELSSKEQPIMKPLGHQHGMAELYASWYHADKLSKIQLSKHSCIMTACECCNISNCNTCLLLCASCIKIQHSRARAPFAQ